MAVNMKYCVVGAGGVGGSITAYMTRAGKDVTAVARGAHLEKLRAQGIRMETTKGDYVISPLKACAADEYDDCPDVVFVCVKGYSLESVVPFIARIAKKDTIVIPLLNLIGTGEKLQKCLPDTLVTDGCVYVAAQIREPGTIRMDGTIFRVVFGVRRPEQLGPKLFEAAGDLRESGIEGILSEDIRRDAFQKFSYVSPMAASGLYFNAAAGRFQVTGDERDTFVALMRELELLAEAMGIGFQVDIVRNNLAILDALSPAASTSMQRDIAAGKQSEIDGLIYEVVRLSGQYGVDMPVYRKIAKAVEKYR